MLGRLKNAYLYPDHLKNVHKMRNYIVHSKRLENQNDFFFGIYVHSNMRYANIRLTKQKKSASKYKIEFNAWFVWLVDL